VPGFSSFACESMVSVLCLRLMAISFWASLAVLRTGAASIPTETDWIVVGGGAAGCTAAAALADAGENVLVLERGPSDREIPTTQSGKGWPQAVVDAVENIRWTDGPWGAVARVLGGGASLNDGYFFEEEPEFLKEMLQLNAEDAADFYASSKYLADKLLTPLPQSDYGLAHAQAVELAGHGKADLQDTTNVRYKDGAWVIRSLFNLSEPTQTRHTPAVLLHERSHMPNLHIATGVSVKKVTFQGTRAVGVVAHVGWSWSATSIKARKGVLMAAGAIYTPQLLQISGVGDSTLLSRLGVPQVVDLPAVGQNFVDRLTWSLQIAAPVSQKADHFLGYTVAADSKAGITFESVGGSGVDSAMAIASLGLAPAKQRDPWLRPVMKVLMASPIGSIVDQMSNVVGLVHDTKSRGGIEAVSQDSSTPPKVTANYFKAEGDLDKMVAALKALINVAGQAPLEPWRTAKVFEPASEVKLGATHTESLRAMGFNVSAQGIPDFLSCLFKAPDEKIKFISLPCIPHDENDWGDFVRENVLSTYHYFGTAAVGSVVDSGTFKVKGTESLYVIDASAIPYSPRINPVGIIMSLGHFVGSKLAKSEPPSIII